MIPKKKAPLVQGTLPNGFRYVVQSLPDVQDVAIQLCVRAGVVHELEGEEGLARFMGHLGLKLSHLYIQNGSEEVIAFEDVKKKFQPVLKVDNDEAIYRLEFLLEDDPKLDKTLSLVKGIASLKDFQSPELEETRLSMQKKWIENQRSSNRWLQELSPILLEGSSYAFRNSYGKQSVIEKCSQSDLTNFYERRYQPQNMCLVVVGSFDPMLIEQKIIGMFSSLEQKNLNIPDYQRETFPIYEHPHVQIFVDEEVSTSIVSLMYRHPKPQIKTIADLERKVVYQLIEIMTLNRLEELTRHQDSSFLRVNALLYPFNQPIEIFEIEAQILREDYQLALKQLVQKLEDIRVFGFSRSEFEQAKNTFFYCLKRESESALNKKTWFVANRYSENFIDHDLMLSNEDLIQKSLEVVRNLHRKDIQPYVNEILSPDQYVVSLFVPSRHADALLKKSEIVKLIANVQACGDHRINKEDPIKSLVIEPLGRGSIEEERVFVEAGAIEWMLSNKVKVCLKPTSIQKNAVVIHGFAQGGAAGLSLESQAAAKVAPYIGIQAGLGGFSPAEIETFLEGKECDFKINIGVNFRQFSAKCSRDDLSSLMALLYLFFTDFDPDEATVSRLLSEYEAKYVNTDSFVNFVENTLSANSQENSYLRPLTKEDLKLVNLESLRSVYNRCFAFPDEFTILVVGDFSLEDAEDCILQYLGSIPPQEGQKPLSNSVCRLVFPNKSEEKEVIQGLNGEAKIHLAFPLQSLNSQESIEEVELVCDIMREHIKDVFSEKKCRIKEFKVKENYPFFPDVSQGFVSVTFDCELEQKDKILSIIFDEIHHLHEEGTKNDLWEKIKLKRSRYISKRHMENAYFIKQLMDSYLWYGVPYKKISEGKEFLPVRKEPQDLFKKWMISDHYVLITFK